MTTPSSAPPSDPTPSPPTPRSRLVSVLTGVAWLALAIHALGWTEPRISGAAARSAEAPTLVLPDPAHPVRPLGEGAWELDLSGLGWPAGPGDPILGRWPVDVREDDRRLSFVPLQERPGAGRFSHLGHRLILGPSGGADPATSGRAYRVTLIRERAATVTELRPGSLRTIALVFVVLGFAAYAGKRPAFSRVSRIGALALVAYLAGCHEIREWGMLGISPDSGSYSAGPAAGIRNGRHPVYPLLVQALRAGEGGAAEILPETDVRWSRPDHPMLGVARGQKLLLYGCFLVLCWVLMREVAPTLVVISAAWVLEKGYLVAEKNELLTEATAQAVTMLLVAAFLAYLLGKGRWWLPVLALLFGGLYLTRPAGIYAALFPAVACTIALVREPRENLPALATAAAVGLVALATPAALTAALGGPGQATGTLPAIRISVALQIAEPEDVELLETERARTFLVRALEAKRPGTWGGGPGPPDGRGARPRVPEPQPLPGRAPPGRRDGLRVERAEGRLRRGGPTHPRGPPRAPGPPGPRRLHPCPRPVPQSPWPRPLPLHGWSFPLILAGAILLAAAGGSPTFFLTATCFAAHLAHLAIVAVFDVPLHRYIHATEILVLVGILVAGSATLERALRVVGERLPARRPPRSHVTMCRHRRPRPDRRPARHPRRSSARFVDLLVHRGPDDEGLWIADGVGLGMRRLSIIDLDGGAQPMTTEDGRYTIVFNGEVYNFEEIRRELEDRGERFRTRCDTEVVLRGWARWGEGVLERMNGMWGFAIHDTVEREAPSLPGPPGQEADLLRADRRGNRLVGRIRDEGPPRGRGDRPAPRPPGADRLPDLRLRGRPPHARPRHRDPARRPPRPDRGRRLDSASPRTGTSHPTRSTTSPGTRRRPAESIYELLVDATRQRLVADVPIAIMRLLGPRLERAGPHPRQGPRCPPPRP